MKTIYKNLQECLLLRKLAVERLKLANSEELLLYLLQLVQALKYEALIYEKVHHSVKDLIRLKIIHRRL